MLKKMSIPFLLLCFVAFLSLRLFSQDSIPPDNVTPAEMQEEMPIPEMPCGPEVWAYLVEGDEKAFTGKEPVTDVCYFRAILNFKGEVIGAGDMPRSVFRKDGVRYHLVIAELSNPAIVHFALQPEFNVRTKLIDSIVTQSAKYDGIQIDFESVPDEDKSLFVSFLKEIKKGIGKKVLSVAVPARTRFVDDAFNYESLVAVADRLIIMAYDEHWKTSAPGPVASLEWCEKVAGYVKTKIPADKLVMGIPLYGRSWQRSRYDKEINYSDAKKITAANKKGAVRKDAKNPGLEYEQRIKVVVYFENATSIMKKVKLYRKNGIDSVAFWRIGQGPSEIWPLLKKDSELKGAQAKK